MHHLSPHEYRILGVLIEKSYTTPAQYPLTLNAMVSGANQKSNRFPVVTLDEDDVLDAVEALRGKGLVREVMLSGSRVEKFRHVVREQMELGKSEAVILAELMLRGPQTVGELRGRAARMHPLESTEVVTAVLEHLMARPEPLVQRLDPLPGSRAPRYTHTLGPPPPEAAITSPAPRPAATPTAATADDALERRVERLEAEVAELRRLIEHPDAG